MKETLWKDSLGNIRIVVKEFGMTVEELENGPSVVADTSDQQGWSFGRCDNIDPCAMIQQKMEGIVTMKQHGLMKWCEPLCVWSVYNRASVQQQLDHIHTVYACRKMKW